MYIFYILGFTMETMPEYIKVHVVNHVNNNCHVIMYLNGLF